MKSFEILYEDGDLLVLNKPAEVATIPERKPTGKDVISIITAETRYKPFVVHRLDKPVSGVLILAKNPEAHKYLNEQFQKRRVHKEYVALVHGAVKQEKGVISAPIRRYGSGRMGVDFRKGKPSITYFIRICSGEEFSLLKVLPITGRQHQIRTHLYHIGHSVAGDLKYGNRKKAKERFSRLMLHCLKIKVTLPSNKSLEIEARFPEDFIEELRLKAPEVYRQLRLVKF
ncbi:MAG TPA: RluA family pseudouridine synthase [Thermodesulforhabdus norvegica]|uniref:Pseudouridine synthase n=1 Tax=Thermodesulforhabdus norvegica TaxID=39841 RepID=A0A7C0WVJ5_9BACT|nr:RluA family pseudouridine synthase [Deltaproteobacteria bacterium]MBW2068192.1 RluA family pseudouridine synthase [Deltaproteobacteria bacterium]HDL90490.1 RluA family pseudouridine synthase [Thermodesulforhabdus norvegica]